MLLLIFAAGATAVYYRAENRRLVAEHRQQLELAGERAAVLTDTLTRAREEAGAIGESLSRQRSSVAELRELIGEIRERYEKMEDLLSSAGDSGVNDDVDTGV